MIDIDEALSLVLQHAQPLPPVSLSLADALGRVLAEDVVSEIDSPPYDKALMDGYAVRAADVAGNPFPGDPHAGASAQGATTLEVLEEVTAGDVPARPVTPGAATRIMTGAPMPAGADAVVMIERTRLLDEGSSPRVQIDDASIVPGANLLPRAHVMRQGEKIFTSGRALRAADLGLLAEIGRSHVRVTPQPRTAVLATGNELVPLGEALGPGQIRNSNEVMLAAQCAQAGAKAVLLGIARDVRQELAGKIEQGMREPILVLSGGVSAGVLDLVPSVLQELGAQQVFHKVRLKPGKPLWFGVCKTGQQTTLVFGLPGNPVSSLVCFELFVRPAIRRLAALAPIELPQTKAQLASGFTHRGNRPTFYPVRLGEREGRLTAAPLDWKGSADLRTVALADGLAHFPAGEREYARGETVDVRILPAAQ